MTVMRRMDQALVAADAPERQLRRVRAWRSDVEYAVASGRLFVQPAGLDEIYDGPLPSLSRGWSRPREVAFLHGKVTHRAWLALCAAIVKQLRVQAAYASTVHEAAVNRAAQARTSIARVRALRAAARADEWCAAAVAAAETGTSVMFQEDAILRPVGMAVAAAGGYREVALDKHYHQWSSR